MSIYFDRPALHCLVLHACRGGTQKYQIYHYTIDSEQIHKYLDLCKLAIESEQITALDTFDGVNENMLGKLRVWGFLGGGWVEMHVRTNFP